MYAITAARPTIRFVFGTLPEKNRTNRRGVAQFGGAQRLGRGFCPRTPPRPISPGRFSYLGTSGSPVLCAVTTRVCPTKNPIRVAPMGSRAVYLPRISPNLTGSKPWDGCTSPGRCFNSHAISSMSRSWRTKVEGENGPFCHLASPLVTMMPAPKLTLESFHRWSAHSNSIARHSPASSNAEFGGWADR